MEKYTVYIGIVAGILTAVSLLPQLIKIIRTRKAGQVSMIMYVVLLAGICGWVAYGFLKKDYPVLFTNLFSLAANSLILVFSHKYKHNGNE